ncbi:hypothetical protein [uncultured Endozoicomonas sp.]|uniref:hypothetical protein n=1 Tax=uncultured Endozoicomonas sp. TaxID=432652 RepID=UPI00261288C2|nr:hypothetical protein [uncultured Endozoicomonas sp.]
MSTPKNKTEFNQLINEYIQMAVEAATVAWKEQNVPHTIYFSHFKKRLKEVQPTWSDELIIRVVIAATNTWEQLNPIEEE